MKANAILPDLEILLGMTAKPWPRGQPEQFIRARRLEIGSICRLV